MIYKNLFLTIKRLTMVENFLKKYYQKSKNYFKNQYKIFISKQIKMFKLKEQKIAL